jgi:hypothetical protein
MLENVTLMESITSKKWDTMGYDIIGGFLSHAGTPKSSIYTWIFHNRNHPVFLGNPHDYGFTSM